MAKMKLVVFLAFLASLVVADLLILRDRLTPATMEFTENIKRSCTSIDIIPGSDPNFNITYMIEMTCRKQNMRQKRFTEYFPVLSWLLKQHNSRNMEKEDQKYIDMLEFSDKMLYLEEVLEMPSINLPFDDIANLINWNGTEIIRYFNYPLGKIEDAWAALAKRTLQCDKANRLEMIVCGNFNPTRRMGLHKIVASIGHFSSLGTVFKYRNISTHAVLYDGKLFSMDSCRFLKNYYECQISRNTTCTVTSPENCPVEVVMAPTKVFVREYVGDYSVVAAVAEAYQTMIHGHYSTHQMGISQHVSLLLPIGSYAKFNNVKVFGKSLNAFDHFAVNTEADHLPVSHEDLDKLEANYGNTEEVLRHRALLKSEFSQFLDRNLMLIIILLTIVFLVTVTIAGVSITLRKKNFQSLPVVLYSNNKVTIIQ
ncbi:Glycoprotein [Caenorhabditis elegans]|uniref:Glycoprotein n=1 Tax=Caenorhabditis elegans TaxID=6239 RepID=Q18015_CAEEL|nr:Glycoprotein [Caenorhabditis elegans]CCD64590.1 Glycoprotein [Caenorhabditis elegans]|eukprot:NP_508545.2 Uncharacterized protein CELE_C15C7.6 [Caenorhabditis elegans]